MVYSSFTLPSVPRIGPGPITTLTKTEDEYPCLILTTVSWLLWQQESVLSGISSPLHPFSSRKKITKQTAWGLFVFFLHLPFSHLLLDGVSVWQPARDAGLPEGVSADTGRENQFVSRLHDTPDGGAAQGNSMCKTLIRHTSTYFYVK